MLWVSLFKVFYGSDGGFELGLRSRSGSGVWSNIDGSINLLHNSGDIHVSTLHKVLGDGAAMRF